MELVQPSFLEPLCDVKKKKTGFFSCADMERKICSHEGKSPKGKNLTLKTW